MSPVGLCEESAGTGYGVQLDRKCSSVLYDDVSLFICRLNSVCCGIASVYIFPSRDIYVIVLDFNIDECEK